MPQKKRIRKTKIVATIGPACDSIDMLAAMIEAGMTVARLNLSHGTYKEHQERIRCIRVAAARTETSVAIMIDTRGIEIRTGQLLQKPVELERGGDFTLFTDGGIGDKSGVSVSYPNLPDEVEPGDTVLIDDGAIELEVKSVSDESIECLVVHGGTLHDNKSVNLPDTTLPMATADPKGREDITAELHFAAENEIDYIAASFIQSAADIITMREILAERDVHIPIIAKIENKAGVTNLEEIVEVADGLMVARGDLGVELPFGEVPGTQKKIIRTTVMNGKPVITATQMLASMEFNPKPTRAEASDVANAVLDGTSAIMLSGETAAGKYPLESVQTMANLALRAEAYLSEYGYLQKIKSHPAFAVTEAVSEAAANMAKQLNAAAVFSLTSTGFTSRLISKHRPECPILAITASRRVARKLALNWGVLPILYSKEPSDKVKLEIAVKRAEKLGYTQSGDVVVATSGSGEKAGGTDLIRVMTLE
jgi:pyruvate kinase